MNGKQYVVRSCIRGSLIELNENLVRDPSLLISDPETNGYIAIVAPKITEIQEIQNSLLSKDNYYTLT